MPVWPVWKVKCFLEKRVLQSTTLLPGNLHLPSELLGFAAGHFFSQEVYMPFEEGISADNALTGTRCWSVRIYSQDFMVSNAILSVVRITRKLISNPMFREMSVGHTFYSFRNKSLTKSILCIKIYIITPPYIVWESHKLPHPWDIRNVVSRCVWYISRWTKLPTGRNVTAVLWLALIELTCIW